MENIMNVVESQYQKKEIPVFRPGDTVKVYYKIVEGDSERTQIFEGTVLRIRGAGNGKTITVRKISFSIGIERIFLLNSPRIENIEIVKRGKVRRSRLYLENADLILLVLDWSRRLDKDDMDIIKKIRDNSKETIVVINKADLKGKLDIKKVKRSKG